MLELYCYIFSYCW